MKSFDLATNAWSGILRNLAGLGRATAFFIRSVKTSLTHPPELNAFLKQTTEIGFESLSVVIAVSIFIGLSTALEGFLAFSRLGGESLVALFASMTQIRELCPAIAAAILTARAGTRMAATLGLMRIREQIDALEVMGVDPVHHLVVPRVWATMLAAPALVLISDAVALGSTFMVSVFQMGQDPVTFWSYVKGHVEPFDLGVGALKGLIFGLFLSVLSCYFGFVAGKGPEGVGRAANQAVVTTAVVLIGLNLLLTWIFYA